MFEHLREKQEQLQVLHNNYSYHAVAFSSAFKVTDLPAIERLQYLFASRCLSLHACALQEPLVYIDTVPEYFERHFLN